MTESAGHAFRTQRPPAIADDDTWVLGLGGSVHDFAAALMCGTDIRVAVEGERVTRVKYGLTEFFADPTDACVRYCLDTEGLREAEVERWVGHDFLPTRTLASRTVATFNHHLCHAASAIMMLPPETSACVIVYDGAGSSWASATDSERDLDCETFSFYSFEDGQLILLGKTLGHQYRQRGAVYNATTNSIGELYEMVSVLLDFGGLEVGKTMGLAAWGRPTYLDILLDATAFEDSLDSVFRADPFNSDLVSRLSERLSAEHNSFAARADLAASIQELLNRCLIHCYQLIAVGEFEVLCLAGGCALNTVANGVLAKRMPAGRRLIVPPHAGDAGLSLGSLWLDARSQTEGPFSLTFRGMDLATHIARPGREYPLARRRTALSYRDVCVDPATRSPADVARRLAEGAIVGVFDGGSEIGPRALGGRSILADPRLSATRETINRRIKRREPFRPLAPVVLAEHFDDFFTPPGAANPFMLVVADATPLCREVAPAVVHVDGSARVQIVDSAEQTFLRVVLESFYDGTGVPILLNTSFNGPGEPIVETPEEAVAAFIALGLDGLWLGPGAYLFSPRPTGSPLNPGFHSEAFAHRA